MIAPLAPCAIRGVLWYQGESNALPTANPKLYGLQLRTMIAQWRQLWQEGDFPFLYVQLPNFNAKQKNPSETGGWPLIREQLLQTLTYRNTGMAVTIDLGEANNVHPVRKEEVGRRLAQWALAKTYHKNVTACGPLYKSMHAQGTRIVVEFDYCDAGLEARGGPRLVGFAIAGEDRRFVWADARIEGDKVVVSSPAVSPPRRSATPGRTIPIAISTTRPACPPPPSAPIPGSGRGRGPEAGSQGSDWGTVPIFVRRKWDCPLMKSGGHSRANPHPDHFGGPRHGD